MSDIIQFRRGREAALPALKPGEPAFTDEGHMEIRGGGSTLVNPDIDKYSTTPVKIGTWIDGKDVMRKCGEVTYAATSNPPFGTFEAVYTPTISGINCDNATFILRENYFVAEIAFDSRACFSDYDAAVKEIQQICSSGKNARVAYIVGYVAHS